MSTLNGKKEQMEAAREAAWQPIRTNLHQRGLPGLYVDTVREGFDLGYNAAQPEPCVWTLSHNPAKFIVGCQDRVTSMKGWGTKYCPYCGGRIEEATQCPK